MRIRQANRSITTAVLLLTLLALACSGLARYYRQREMQANQAQLQAERLCTQFRFGSDRLTAAVRAYASTGEKRYRDEFEAEIRQDRNRDLAAQGLNHLGLTPEESQALDTSRQNSDNLVDLENRAFMAAEKGDNKTAIQLVYGAEYASAKDSILRPLEEFRRALDERLAREASELAQSSRQLHGAALLSLMFNATATLAALLLFYRRQIVMPLASLEQNLKDLLAKKPGVSVGFQENTSEIGELARSLETYRKAADEAEQQRQIKAHLTSMVSALQTAQTPQDFAERLLTQLCPVLQAPCAALYLLDEDTGRYLFTGGYAYQPQQPERSSFAPGESLCGQCVLERKTLVLSQIPPEYINIVSGTGQAPPTFLIATPILSRGRVLAVLESALLHPLQDSQQVFLQEVCEVVALNLEILLRNLKTRKLLDRIRESEEHSRLILESTGEGIFGVDPQGMITFVNPACCKLLGYQAEELIGQNSHSLIHHHRANGDVYPVEECPMYAAYTKGKASRIRDEFLWRKDGTNLPVEYAAVPIAKDGHLLGAVVSFSDTSEQRRSTESLRRQGSLLGSLLNSMPDLIFYKDLNGVYMGCNQAFGQLVGLEASEVVGMVDQDLFPVEVAQAFRQRDLAIIEAGQAQSVEEWVDHPDGRKLLLETKKTPIRAQDGAVLGLLGVSRDITDRYCREETLRIIYRSVRAGVVLFDKDRVFDVNPAALSLLKISHPQDLQARSLFQRIPEFQPDGSNSVQRAQELLQQAHSQKQVSGPFVFLRDDGSPLPTEINLTLVPRPSGDAILAILRPGHEGLEAVETEPPVL